jgi:hypothetical protein
MKTVYWIATVVVAIAGLFAAFDLARTAGICQDEPKHLATSLCVREQRVFVAKDGSPLAVLWSLPFGPAEREVARGWDPEAVRAGPAVWETGLSFLAASGGRAAVVRARSMSVVVFALLLALVAWAGARLAGPAGAFVATALVATCPAVLAHAGLVSPDLLATTAAVAFALALLELQRRGGALGFVLVAFTAALAIAAKLTCLSIVAAACLGWALPRTRSWRRVILGLAAGLLGVLVADLTYRCVGSSLLEPIQTSRALAAGQLDVYFLGTLRPPGPWFYPVILAGKLTPLLAAAVGASCVALVVDRANRARHATGWIAFGVPALALLAALAISGYAQGYRYLLPMFPLLALAAAPAASELLQSRRAWVRGAALGAVLAQAAATIGVHPDHLAYWNVFVGGAAGGSRIAVDSNADWGQSVPALDAWADAQGLEHLYTLLNTVVPSDDPRRVGIPALGAALAGHQPLDRSAIAVSRTYVRVAEVQRTATEPVKRFVTALTDVEPDAVIGDSILVWRVTPQVEAIARAQIAATLTR